MDVKAALRDIASGLANQVTRARHVLSAYSKDGQRTMLQVTGFDGEVHEQIELILPYGMSALPVGNTADTITLQVNAVRDHKIALGTDDPALRISDLQVSEFGFRNNRGSQVVFRKNKIEVTAAQDDIVVTATQGNITATAAQGNVSVTASQGNVAVTATQKNITLSAPAGSITMTALPNHITANGNVLG